MTATVPLKRVAKIIAGQSPPSEVVSLFDGSEMPFLQGNAEFGQMYPTARLQCASAPKRAERGDVLLSVRAPVGALNTADRAYGIGRGLCAIRPSGVEPSFAWWAALATVPLLAAVATGSTYDAVAADDVGALPFPIPPPHIQRDIADYLDRETSQIDALIAAKQRMVGLLEEERTALATDLLLGPPREHSGAGPRQVTLRSGWSLVPFRRLFREVDVRSQTGAETLLSVSQTRGVIPQSELGDRRQYAETLVGYKLCRPGDLVVNRMWVYYGALGVSPTTGIVSPDYSVFRPIADMSSEFAAYVLRTPAYVGEMTRLVRGIGAAFQGAVRKPRLHPNELGLIDMPLPPATDQARLLRALDAQTKAIGHRIALLTRSLDLLGERRHALITAVVSGEVEIREAA